MKISEDRLERVLLDTVRTTGQGDYEELASGLRRLGVEVTGHQANHVLQRLYNKGLLTFSKASVSDPTAGRAWFVYRPI